MGLIKDLVVSLHQIPKKSVVMDIVVADVPANLECCCPDLGQQNLKVLCKWTLAMTLSQFLTNIEDYGEKAG